ncbi:hypothetical protein OK349_05445 [Sphingomonas sp. BT-65]|uniref:hypothetical protein n=1 Tax=Sphingomonas sp. BT-65 TaxID=2989821 RepID=UPI002236B977|nr:hypothetical protein [Sphingomonas sp. BT-65]MCW4461144.1 hypothetical protein [Sphingomonas sp. BT-65]
MHKALVLTAIASFALTGCAATAANPREGPARLGQTVYVDGPRVTPVRVIEDSRCPVNVSCIWAGRVVLRATVRGGAWAHTIDLTLGEPVQVADGALTLTSVTPGRHADRRVAPRDYRFAFTFQGGL